MITEREPGTSRQEFLQQGQAAVHDRLLKEELILLNDARKLFPQRPSKETLWRWALGRGRLGQRLESTLIGGVNRYTSRQACDRFIAAVNAASEAARAERDDPARTPGPS